MGYFSSLSSRQPLSPRHAAPATKLGGRLVLAVVGLAGLLNFASRDPHDVDGVPDNIGWTLLTFWTFGHMLSAKHSTTMNRTQRAIVILASTALIFMILFPPITATIDYEPGPLPSEPFAPVDGVRPEPEQTATQYRADAYATLMSAAESPRVSYRFIALPPIIGSGAVTRDYGSNTMLRATYGVAWTVFIRNVVVLLLIAGAAFLIAAPQRNRP